MCTPTEFGMFERPTPGGSRKRARAHEGRLYMALSYWFELQDSYRQKMPKALKDHGRKLLTS